jgi:ABC-type Fe2+-enterobactin transport system substrate-binding protein
VDAGIGSGQAAAPAGLYAGDLPAGLQTSKARANATTLFSWAGKPGDGLNGEGLFLFAGDQKDVDAIYANPLLAHLPAVKTNASGRWERRRSAWITTARCWCCSV